MMKKLATPGCRVAPMYCDGSNGTIIEVLDDLNVMVLWDVDKVPNGQPAWLSVAQPFCEQIKYLRKGN